MLYARGLPKKNQKKQATKKQPGKQQPTDFPFFFAG
jgi:hypothetical protein